MMFALPQDSFRGPHCGVLATAVAAGKSLTETFTLYRNFLKEKHEYSARWKGGLHTYQMTRMLDRLGVEYDQLEHDHVKGVTVQKFVKEIANPKKVYMVFTRTHVQTIFGDEVLDQGGIKNITEFRDRRKRIQVVLDLGVPTPSQVLHIAEAQTFGLPLFDRKEI